MAQQKSKTTAYRPSVSTGKAENRPSAILINIMIVAIVLMGGAIAYILLNKDQYLESISKVQKNKPKKTKQSQDIEEEDTEIIEEKELLKKTEITIIDEESGDNTPDHVSQTTSYEERKKTVENNKETEINNRYNKQYTTKSGVYCIAAGSFTDKRNADKQVQRLKKLGLFADLAKYRKGKFILYRVCIESSTDKEALKKKIYPLREQYGIDFWVVEK